MLCNLFVGRFCMSACAVYMFMFTCAFTYVCENDCMCAFVCIKVSACLHQSIYLPFGMHGVQCTNFERIHVGVLCMGLSII